MPATHTDDEWEEYIHFVLGPDITSLLPYLAQKWNREGMPPRQIASILNRPVRLIERALDIRLPDEQYDDMERFERV